MADTGWDKDGRATALWGTPAGTFEVRIGGSGDSSFGDGVGEGERDRDGERDGRLELGRERDAGIVTVPPSCF